MTTYFWSDTHFNHENIAKFCPSTRPFCGIEGMNSWLVEVWNSIVGKRDSVFLLGDFAFKHPRGWDLDYLFMALQGRKHLVVGNHDEKNPKVLALPWESVSDLVTVRENGMRAVACHYPLETWKQAHRGYLMLHGHSHGSLKRVIPHRFDVGVDAEGFLGPLSFDELWQRASEQTFEPADHHGDA